MKYNAFLAAFLLSVLAGPWGVLAEEEEEGGFREALFMSEIDRDQRTPQAVRVGGVVFVSAMTGPGETVDEQVRTTYMRLQSVLGNFGLSMAEVAQERIYLRSGESAEAVLRARLQFYGEATAPASTLVEVAGVSGEGALVSIELIAVANPEFE